MGPRSAVLGRRERMRAVALTPSVELPLGPRNAVRGGRKCQIGCFGVHARGPTACRWSSLRGHET
eukprot:625384-Pyramimonas_sp.AAC.1